MPESAPVTKMAPVSGCFLCAGDSHAGCAWATTASASQSQVGAPAPGAVPAPGLAGPL